MHPYAILGSDPALCDAEGPIVDVYGEALGVVTFGGLSLVHGPMPTRAEPESFMQVITELGDLQPIVPMQATEDPIDEASAVRLLRAGSERFRRLLALFAENEEWSVRIATPSGESVAHPSSAERSAGACYLEERRRSFHRDAGIDPIPGQEATRFASLFASIATDLRVNATGDGGASLAALVPHRHRGLVRGVFEQGAAGALAGAALTGPWPAFSFTSL